MRLVLVRHGETYWNQQKRIQGGGSDTQLSLTGKEQADKLAKRLQKLKIEAIYSSPLKRARDTAEAIARYHNITVQICHDLREIDVGEFEGRTLDSFATDFGSFLIQYSGDDGGIKLPGGESLAGFSQRVWNLVQNLIPQHRDDVIIVSHYFVTLSIICNVLEMSISGIRKIRIQPGSISIIDFSGKYPVLSVFGDNCHLK